MISYENRLLKVTWIPYNCEVLINNLIDFYNRLVKLCEHKKYLIRQKIISNLNREAIECTLGKVRHEEEIYNIDSLDKDKLETNSKVKEHAALIGKVNE